MSTKSKNWNDANLKDVYHVKTYLRKDGGITLQYSYLSGLKDEWMSERFEKGEEVIYRA